jgi:hypothetical protein
VWSLKRDARCSMACPACVLWSASVGALSAICCVRAAGCRQIRDKTSESGSSKARARLSVRGSCSGCLRDVQGRAKRECMAGRKYIAAMTATRACLTCNLNAQTASLDAGAQRTFRAASLAAQLYNPSPPRHSGEVVFTVPLCARELAETLELRGRRSRRGRGRGRAWGAVL